MFHLHCRMLRFSHNLATLGLTLLMSTSLVNASDPATNDPPQLKSQQREPVTLTVRDGELLVGNRSSGTISVIDVRQQRVAAEHRIARRIADMIRSENDHSLFVIADHDRQLLRVELEGDEVVAKPVAEIPHSSTKLAIDEANRRLFVTAKWSHELIALQFDGEFQQLQSRQTLTLPFAPRELILLSQNGKLLIADAFRGRIAIVDTKANQLLGVRTIEGHNIRGLATNSEATELFVAHQQIIDRSRADFEEIHWARMVKNTVQVFDLAKFIADEESPERAGWLDVHGGIGGATADPSSVFVGSEDLTAVTFSGVNEVAIRHRNRLSRLNVGRHPQAMAVFGSTLCVANSFDDSISLIDVKRSRVVATISLGPRPSLESVERGRQLFYDARLSHEGWLSCHSCHTDGHSTDLVVDTLGDNDYGAPKRVPSLLGVGSTKPWAWNGSIDSLGAQVDKSVETTMHGSPLNATQRKDLVAFLKSLPPAPAVNTSGHPLIKTGRRVFAARGCIECHDGPKFTSTDVFDVGLRDERGRKLFNPPSLRGVSQRSRFFHDGRVSSLKAVLVDEQHGLDRPLPRQEVEALIAYLRSL